MSLSGTLSTMNLPDLLQWLHGAGKTGVLEVRGERYRKRIFFAKGEITGTSSDDPTEYLGQFLLSHGAITEEDLKQGMETQKQTGVMLGKILIMVGKLSAEQVKRFLILKAEETIFSLFLWDDAHFELFEEKEPRTDQVPLNISISDLLIRGLSRYDEMQRIKEVLGTPSSVVGRAETVPEEEFFADQRHRAIWERIDGARTIADIAMETHMSESLACEVLHLLYEMGHVKVVRRVTAQEVEQSWTPTPEDPVAEGRRLLKRGDLEAALDVVDRAVSRDSQAADLRGLLKEAEDAYVKKAYRYYLAPEKIPFLVKPLDSLTDKDLSPQEMFLLSRINGTWDVRSVVTVAPFTEVEALRTLQNLRRKEIIDLK